MTGRCLKRMKRLRGSACNLILYATSDSKVELIHCFAPTDGCLVITNASSTKSLLAALSHFVCTAKWRSGRVCSSLKKQCLIAMKLCRRLIEKDSIKAIHLIHLSYFEFTGNCCTNSRSIEIKVFKYSLLGPEHLNCFFDNSSKAFPSCIQRVVHVRAPNTYYISIFAFHLKCSVSNHLGYLQFVEKNALHLFSSIVSSISLPI